MMAHRHYRSRMVLEDGLLEHGRFEHCLRIKFFLFGPWKNSTGLLQYKATHDTKKAATDEQVLRIWSSAARE